MKATNKKGVQERVGKDGVISYFINYYELGKKINVKVGTDKTGMTPKKASMIRAKKVVETEKKKEAFKNSSQTKSEFEVGEMTLDEVFEKYYIGANSSLTSITQRKQNYYNKISPLIGLVKIKDLDESHRQKIYDFHKATGKNTIGSINTYMALAQAVINKLVENNLYRNRNPFKYSRGKKPQQALTRREGSLTPKELRKLEEHIRINYSHLTNYDQYILWLSLAVSTGGRANTILKIKTHDLEFNGLTGTVMLRESKTLTNVKAHINPDIVPKLREFHHLHGVKNVKLFTTSYTVLYRFFKKVFDELFNCKLDPEDEEAYNNSKIVLHSIRHSFANILIEKNINLIHIQKLMGHKKIETTANYVTSSEEKQKEAFYIYMEALQGQSIEDFE